MTSDAGEDSLPTVRAKSGDLLIAGGGIITSGTFGHTVTFASTNAAEVLSVANKKFGATDSMASKRGGIQAIPFKNGALAHQVLIPGGTSWTGGFDGSNGLVTVGGGTAAKAELYKASNFIAGASIPPLGAFYTATLLGDGTVLITGGAIGKAPVKTAMIFNPSTNKFVTIAKMKSARAMHTATLLPSGKVLIAGGIGSANGTTATSGELYDPNAKTFTRISSPMPTGVAAHTATLISGCGCANDGKVLLAGGIAGTGNSSSPAFENSQAQTMYYDPAANAFSASANMREARVFHSAALVNGKVLIAGGAKGLVQFGNGTFTMFMGSSLLQTAELFDPMTSTATCVGGTSGSACATSLKAGRAGHSATLFTSGAYKGKVLLAGGNPTPSSELYNAATGNFNAGPKMKVARVFHAAAVVP